MGDTQTSRSLEEDYRQKLKTNVIKMIESGVTAPHPSTIFRPVHQVGI